jgi:methylisocitrate lyase
MRDPRNARCSLKEHLNNGETVVAPGCYDAVTASVVQELGFNAAYMGGWMTGAALGTTEPLLTLLDQVENARRALRLLEIPLIVDGHTGFGDPLHIMRTVQEYENAGISAMHIEDQVYPKRVHYYAGKEHIVPLKEHIERLGYALRARNDENFMIIARTDARRAAEGGTIEAVLERVSALSEVGVDAIMPQVCDVDEMKRVRDAVPENVPLLAMAGYGSKWGIQETLTWQEISNLGYQIIIYPITTIVATIGAALSINRMIKEQGRAPTSGGFVGFEAPRYNEVIAKIEGMIGVDRLCEVERQTVER